MFKITGDLRLDVLIVFIGVTLISYLIGFLIKKYVKRPDAPIGGDLNSKP